MRLIAPNLCLRAATAGAAAVVLAGCSGGAIAPEKARTMAVAEAAGGQLAGDALDRWLVAANSIPTKAEANGLVSTWVNNAVLIEAFRKNTPLDDQATFDSVIMEAAARTAVGQYFAARDSQLPAVTERQVDSMLDTDQARVFQQIVVRLKGKPDSASVSAVKQRAEQILAKLRKGSDFTAMVKESSEDSVSRANNGFIPAMTAADMPEKLQSVFNLGANGISPIIAHPRLPQLIIMRRATRQESRAGIRTWLAPRLARRADSLFVDSIARAKAIVIAPDARIRTREMAHEPVNLVDGPPLATWQGGGLPPAAVRNATLTLSPQDRYGLTDAPDTVVTQFLMGLARREILLPIVAKEPLPTAAVRTSIMPAYRRVLDSLRAAVSRLPAGESVADAATHQIDSVLAQRAPFLPLPGGLTAVLRSRSPVKVNQPVIEAIVRGSVSRWQLVHKDDSTVRTGKPAITPAPGGAPTPGGAPARGGATKP